MRSRGLSQLEYPQHCAAIGRAHEFRHQHGIAKGYTAYTDAYSVSGDVLTLHRQLISVTAAGQMRVMQDPPNNFRHTYLYRRETQAAAP